MAVTEGDAVYHFYITKEANALPHWVTPAGNHALSLTPAKFWLELFPKVMEQVARDYFDSDERRLVAAYTEEKASWWLRAKGAGMKLDPQRFALGFCDKLDAALESSMENAK